VEVKTFEGKTISVKFRQVETTKKLSTKHAGFDTGQECFHRNIVMFYHVKQVTL